MLVSLVLSIKSVGVCVRVSASVHVSVSTNTSKLLVLV